MDWDRFKQGMPLAHARRTCKTLALFGLLSAAAGGASADTVLGIYAGFGSWQQQADGDLRSGISQVDVEDDLGIDDDRDVVAYFALEHPIPALPNIRLQYANTELAGDEVLTRSIEVNGVNFSFADEVRTEIELTQADAVFYYEVLDNYLSLDLGLAVRFVDGRVVVSSTAEQAEADFDGALPLLYGAARVDLPLSGWSVSAQLMGAGYDGDQLLDARARIAYESGLGLGAELGWRTLQLELDEYDDLDQADLNISGPFLMINYHF